MDIIIIIPKSGGFLYQLNKILNSIIACQNNNYSGLWTWWYVYSLDDDDNGSFLNAFYPKLIKFCTLKVYSFWHVSHTSIN